MYPRRLIGLILCLAACAVPATASASTPYDLRGTWHDQNSLGYASTFYIDTTNLETGQFTGHSAGFTFSALAHGLSYTETIKQVGTTYQSYVKGTVSEGGNKLSGSFHDTNHNAGTFISTRLSGPPVTEPSPTVNEMAGIKLGVSLRIACLHPAPCARATIVLTPSSDPAPTAASAGVTGTPPTATILGHKRIKVGAHKTVTVAAHLNSRGRAQLVQAGARGLSVRVTVFANGSVIHTGLVQIHS